MGRRADPHRREELLDAVVTYLLENGLGNLSLRPLASAIKTSPRMLLYHFGSKDQLIAAALARVRDREQEFIDGSIRAGGNPFDVFGAVWRWMTSPSAQPFLRLFFQIYAWSLLEPERFDRFAERAVKDWLPVFHQAVSSDAMNDADQWSTLLVAASRGLLLDLLATREAKRVNAAADLLTRLLRERIGGW